ncbi:hypothetical protein T459_09319 [Capsicum annuum]|uniref:Uncharacterized protein n=1 Tax=Capsicum annuum TaxID=4072 RepID=A0A2G2ZZ07_CAPAN|nr:hypothetical protein T459_09319 [Capsicum annuum]
MEIIYQGEIPIPVRRNSSYDEFVASLMQSGDLDCAPSDMVISYVMHSREKVNPTIINSDVCVLTYIMDADADGFRPILRINVVERLGQDRIYLEWELRRIARFLRVILERLGMEGPDYITSPPFP